MKKRVSLAVLLTGAFIGILATSDLAWTQTSGGASDYIFRFNSGISSVFLSTTTFSSERPLNLGACTVNEKVNGPLSCAVNCDQDSVCLLELSGPPGATVNDVMEKVSETPAAGATAAPTLTLTPVSSRAGRWIQVPDATGSAASARIEAYNSG